jgi:serine/threonine-protein kinase
VPIAVAPNEYGIPRVSPDGTKVALTVFSGNKSDIWTLDLVSRNMSRLTFNDESRWPLWSRDGKRIAFVSYANKSKLELYWKAADGTGKDELLLSLPSSAIYPWSWSDNGKTLVLATNMGEGLDIRALSMEGDHKVRMLLMEKYHETQPKISPDGKWMAYVSNESGNLEVYVRPFPEVDKGKWQVSTSGGAGPLWSPDGRELFYFSGDAFIAVPVKTEPAFSFETAKILFQGKYFNDGPIKAWDISPDGKRFLMIKDVTPTAKPAVPEAPRKITVVVNWTEELKQRVPAK